MGLFDFARELGRQVFDRDEVAADKIQEHLETALTPIKDLEVDYDDGVVTLCGGCVSEADRDLAVLTAGNIAGVKQVISTDLTAPPPKPEVPEPKFEIYEIVSGDTLGGIAKKFLGSAGAYMKIFEANTNILDDPNKIFPGQKIRIPLD